MQFLIGSAYGDYNGSFPGWHLHTGSGPRYFDTLVIFQSPFATLPAVQVNLSEIDADAGPNLRVQAVAINITNVGFTLRIDTWADTKLYAVQANWFAFIPCPCCH
jgi:hypothetical protein